MTKEVDSPLTILPVQNLVSGVYVVKVGERVEKFIKEWVHQKMICPIQ